MTMEIKWTPWAQDVYCPSYWMKSVVGLDSLENPYYHEAILTKENRTSRFGGREIRLCAKVMGGAYGETCFLDEERTVCPGNVAATVKALQRLVEEAIQLAERQEALSV